MATSLRKTKFIHPNGARLLSLDGGGVRGIVSLIILDEIMKRILVQMELSGMPRPIDYPRPADYFELAAGTSTGGIIAIMLFRLHMTTKQAIEQYESLSQEVFRPKVFGWGVPTWMEGIVNSIKTVFQNSRFDSATLEKSIDGVVEKHGLNETDKAKKGRALLHHQGASKMDETVLLRSYPITSNYTESIVNNALQEGKNEISISLAVKATSAAPTFFPDVVWKPKGVEEGLVFWDGGLLNNNPIDQLWYARYDVVGSKESEPCISCIISLGTGYTKPGSSLSSWSKLVGVVSSVVALATNTNAKGKEFTRHISDLKERPGYKDTKYIRFNPSLENNKIGLADYTKMDLLKRLTKTYLQDTKEQTYLNMAVDAIYPRKMSS
ncbi:hypothetical protein BGZ98_005175 [Dissophora globulifera]|nr:hypothetical protein BGZ98_005175 [Dissophora globulifera]